MKKKYLIYSLYATLLIGGAIVLLAWRRKAANIAETFINEHEIGNNAGFANAAFQQMLADVGWRGGESWCMYFVIAVWVQAFPKKAAIIRKYLNGSTQQSWKNAKAHPEYFKVITDGKPLPGDIFIWQNVNGPATGHAGIDIKNIADNNSKVAEGNSGYGGTREGQGVVINIRENVPGALQGNLRLLGFIRLRA